MQDQDPDHSDKDQGRALGLNALSGLQAEGA